jgi:P-type Ca2+ transporter type 2C
VPAAALFLATELPGLQGALMTTSLTGSQWLASVVLALALPVVIEVSKWVRRRRMPAAPVPETQRAVAPQRALAATSTR